MYGSTYRELRALLVVLILRKLGFGKCARSEVENDCLALEGKELNKLEIGTFRRKEHLPNPYSLATPSSSLHQPHHLQLHFPTAVDR